MADDDFTLLANPEETFFEHGYKDGYAHGRIHGLIEGRAAGKEKGQELWEEVGYYEGFALFWKALESGASSSASSRTAHHISSLLSSIEKFPLVNPKPIESTSQPSDGQDDQLDVSKLLSQIRSRYKALCASLGVPVTRLRALSTGEYVLSPDKIVDLRVDPTGSKSAGSKKVWDVDEVAKPQTSFEI